MGICGIIAEYNPFHYGHAYHLKKAREMTGADYVILVMSGNFVQRGEPAILDAPTRAEMALRMGVDLVLELPVSFATGTAEHFAHGGIEILHRLGLVTDLVCGAETQDAEFMEKLTEILVDEPEEYRQILQDLVRQGMLFPAARAQAAESLLPGSAAILSSPNNILALEYRKAIRRHPHCRIRPTEMLRLGSGYHDQDLSSPRSFASATGIRQALRQGNKEGLDQYMPTEALDHAPALIFPEDMTALMNQTLILRRPEELISCQDMTPALLNRLLRQFRENPYLTFPERADALTNRQITRTRANRALLHCALQLHEESEIPAVRILGFRRSAGPLLRKLQDNSRIPLVTKLADAQPTWFSQDLRAAQVYHQLVWEKSGTCPKDEYRRGIIIL